MIAQYIRNIVVIVFTIEQNKFIFFNNLEARFGFFSNNSQHNIQAVIFH